MTAISAAQVIREFVAKLAPRQIFCSKDLLSLAKRSQLDNITSDLVAKQIIVRLARGVFCRRDEKHTSMPSLEEIIEAKARAWKRRLGRASKKILKKLHPTKPKARNRTFLTTSATSSMQTIYGRVHYRRCKVNLFAPATTNDDLSFQSLLQTLINEATDFCTRTALQAILNTAPNWFAR